MNKSIVSKILLEISILLILYLSFNYSIIINYFLIFFLSALFVFFDLDKDISILFLLLPFSPIIKFSKESFSGFIILEIIIIIKAFLKNNFTFDKKRAIVLLLFLSLLLVSTIYNGISNITTYIGFLIAILTFVSLFYSINKKSVVSWGQSFSIGLVFSSILSCFKNDLMKSFILSGVNDAAIKLLESSGEINRFYGLFGDPNILSAYSIIAFSTMMFLIINKKGSLIFNVLLIIPIIYFGLLTISKTFIIILLLYFLIMVYILLKNKKYKLLLMILSICLIGGIIVVNIPSLFTIIENYIERFTISKNSDSTLNELSTNRINIWKTYLDDYKNSKRMLLGLGLNGGLTLKLSPHNTYIQIVYTTGIIGFLLLNIYFYKCINELVVFYNINAKNMINHLIIIICVLLVMLSLEMFLFDSTYIFLALGLSAIVVE